MSKEIKFTGTSLRGGKNSLHNHFFAKQLIEKVEKERFYRFAVLGNKDSRRILLVLCKEKLIEKFGRDNIEFVTLTVGEEFVYEVRLLT